MSAEQTNTLVQRRARSAREAQAARTMSLARALRLTAAKQADQLMGLALSALSITRRDISAEDVSEQLDPAFLMLLLDGTGDQVGAAALDPVLVAGLIQQQTMGKVKPVAEGADVRRHTATDAALCAPFIESLLSRAARLPDTAEECNLLDGFRFGVWAREPRQAQLALEANDYTLVEMTLDMAAGTRAGKLILLLPKPQRTPLDSDVALEASEIPAPMVTLGKNVMALNAELMIALTKLSLPLQQISAFKVGDMVDLNLSSMAYALVIDGNGRAISRGTLGQIHGMRALQVEQRSVHQHTQPRRRTSDREELDLPDVTAPPVSGPGSEDKTDVPLPRLADMDVFGNLDDMPDLPDMDEAAEAADTHVTDWKAEQKNQANDETEDRRHQTQTG